MKYNGTNGYELWNWNFTWNPGNHTYLRYLFVTDTYNYTYLAWIHGYYYDFFYYWYGELHLAKFNSTSGEQIWNCSKSGIEAYYAAMVIDQFDHIHLCGNIAYPNWASYNNNIFRLKIVKYNSLGILQWNKTSSYNIRESIFLRTIRLDSLNNLYIGGEVGYGPSDNWEENIFLAKYDESGQFKWYKEWDGKGKDYINAIYIDSSDNVYITGHTSNRMFLIKYDMFGESLLNYTWNGGNAWCKSIVLDSSGSIYIAGETDYFDNSKNDIILFEFDYSGNLDTIRLWGRGGNEVFNSILLDTSGNVYISGTTDSYGAGAQDMFLLKNPIKIIEGGDNKAITSYDLFIFVYVIFICSIYLSKKQLRSYKKR